MHPPPPTPAASVGDLEAPHVFAHALARYSERGEIVLGVTDAATQGWAVAFLLTLRSLDIGHSLFVASSADVCTSLQLRLSTHTGCGHSTYLRASSGNASVVTALERWRMTDDSHAFHLWWQVPCHPFSLLTIYLTTACPLRVASSCGSAHATSHGRPLSTTACSASTPTSPYVR
jgi:hypothetical protein